MTALLDALTAYQRFDPLGWARVARLLPPWGGVTLAAVGLLFLLAGNGRLFRLVAGPVGVIAGLAWAPLLAQKFGLGSMANQVRIVAPVVLGALCLALPGAASFLGIGIPVGLVVGALTGDADWILGFVPGFLAAGALAAAAHRHLAAVVASVLGAWCLVLGLLATLRAVVRAADAVLDQPWGVLAAATLFAVAGTVYQLFVRLSPEERAAFKAEKARAKRKRSEADALEKRWSNYSKDKGL